jgi:hypothetical protein
MEKDRVTLKKEMDPSGVGQEYADKLVQMSIVDLKNEVERVRSLGTNESYRGLFAWIGYQECCRRLL